MAGGRQAPRKLIPATIAQVGWMEGAWVAKDGSVSIEERWTPPAGGAMLAVSRTLKNGRMAGFEFLRIVERDGGLVYVAQPGGKPPTDFTLTAHFREQRHVRESRARLPEADSLHEAARRHARSARRRRRREGRDRTYLRKRSDVLVGAMST